MGSFFDSFGWNFNPCSAFLRDISLPWEENLTDWQVYQPNLHRCRLHQYDRQTCQTCILISLNLIISCQRWLKWCLDSPLRYQLMPIYGYSFRHHQNNMPSSKLPHLQYLWLHLLRVLVQLFLQVLIIAWSIICSSQLSTSSQRVPCHSRFLQNYPASYFSSSLSPAVMAYTILLNNIIIKNG